MRAGASNSFSSSHTESQAESSEAGFVQSLFEVFLWKLPLQLLYKPDERISFITSQASI